MRSPVRRPFGPTIARRLAAVAVSALFAAGAALGFAAGSQAATAPPSISPPPAAAPATVTQTLGVRSDPIEIVLLVDISLSTGPAYDDLYPIIRKKVLSYLGVLAQQQPQDLVGVIAFGKASDNQVIDPGPPSPDIWLPTEPYSQQTDFGWAFQQAVQMLRAAPQNIKAGAVLLLSDGELSVAPGEDPVYGTGFTGPGWANLRAQVQKLSADRFPITGYDVPLTNNTAYTGNQNEALEQVFQPVQSLPPGTKDLSSALSLATQGTLDSAVKRAAGQDAGQGISVVVSGPHGAGNKPVDLGTGQAEASVTITANTPNVPLYVSGISLVSTGLPVTMRGALPGGYLLAGQQSARWNVKLTWRPRSVRASTFGGPYTTHGRLTLHAAVSSPFTPTLQSTFGDTGFSVGGIRLLISPQFPATEPAGYNIPLIVGLSLLCAFLIALFGAAAARARLTGELDVTPTNGFRQTFPLRGWRKSVWIERPTGKPRRMTVHGSVLSRWMHLKMPVDGLSPHKSTLPPGRDKFYGGMVVVHKVRGKRGDPAAASQDPADPSQQPAAASQDPADPNQKPADLNQEKN